MYCLHSGWHVSGTAYCSFLSHFTSFEHRIHFERCSRGDSNFQLNVYVRSNTQLGVRPTASYSGSSPKVDEYITYMESYRGATWCDHVSKMLLLFENPASKWLDKCPFDAYHSWNFLGKDFLDYNDTWGHSKSNNLKPWGLWLEKNTLGHPPSPATKNRQFEQLRHVQNRHDIMTWHPMIRIGFFMYPYTGVS